MKKAFSAQSSSGGLALGIIAAAVEVTATAGLWPDFSCCGAPPTVIRCLSFMPLLKGPLRGYMCEVVPESRKLEEQWKKNMKRFFCNFRNTCRRWKKNRSGFQEEGYNYDNPFSLSNLQALHCPGNCIWNATGQFAKSGNTLTLSLLLSPPLLILHLLLLSAI